MSTKIEWVQNPDGTKGETWNPVTGCTKTSEGCRNCYAERMARRLAGRHGYPEAPHHFDVTLRPERLEQPLRWKKPRTVFVCSMSDLFHEDVPDRFIFDVFRTIDITPGHTYQILTKRPRRIYDMMVKGWLAAPLPENVYLGVTAENQAAADERREHLRQCPAAVKFVSYEPALGPVDWIGWEFVDQIISGGESGPGARPAHPDWHRATRDFCQANEIAYFFKSWGAWVPVGQWNATCQEKLSIANSGRVYHWPDDSDSLRVGKRTAGRLLDGRAWDEFPDRGEQ